MLTHLTKIRIPLFKEYLEARNIEYRDGKGSYEVMQVQTKEGWAPIHRKESTPRMVVSNQYLDNVIDDFMELQQPTHAPASKIEEFTPAPGPILVDPLNRIQMVVSLLNGKLASNNSFNLDSVDDEIIEKMYSIVDSVIEKGS